MREDIVVHNFSEEPAFCSIELLLGCDFADLFEVKEGRVEKLGDLSVRSSASRITFDYRRGGFRRSSIVDFSVEPRIDEATASYEVIVPARGDWTTCIQVTPVIDGQEITPRYLCGQSVERTTPGRAARRVAAAASGDHERSRPVPPAARALDRGSRRAADLRSRLPRSRGRRRGCAVVHDAVRPRLAAHVVDDDDRRPRSRARHARDARSVPGHRGEPADRGGTGSHPARDALRRDRVAVARRWTRLLRHRRRDAVVRHAAR